MDYPASRIGPSDGISRLRPALLELRVSHGRWLEQLPRAVEIDDLREEGYGAGDVL